MPTIPTLPKKPKQPRNEHTDSRELRQKAYQTTAWKKLRASYLKNHPLCEECLKNGKVTPANQVHHKKSPFSHGSINYAALLDDTNLESICSDCHGKLHAEQQGHKSISSILQQLDDLFNEEITDEEIEGNDNQ